MWVKVREVSQDLTYSDYGVGRFENAKFLKIILEHVDLAVIHKK